MVEHTSTTMLDDLRVLQLDEVQRCRYFELLGMALKCGAGGALCTKGGALSAELLCSRLQIPFEDFMETWRILNHSGLMESENGAYFMAGCSAEEPEPVPSAQDMRQYWRERKQLSRSNQRRAYSGQAEIPDLRQVVAEKVDSTHAGAVNTAVKDMSRTPCTAEAGKSMPGGGQAEQADISTPALQEAAQDRDGIWESEPFTDGRELDERFLEHMSPENRKMYLGIRTLSRYYQSEAKANISLLNLAATVGRLFPELYTAIVDDQDLVMTIEAYSEVCLYETIPDEVLENIPENFPHDFMDVLQEPGVDTVKDSVKDSIQSPIPALGLQNVLDMSMDTSGLCPRTCPQTSPWTRPRTSPRTCPQKWAKKRVINTNININGKVLSDCMYDSFVTDFFVRKIRASDSLLALPGISEQSFRAQELTQSDKSPPNLALPDKPPPDILVRAVPEPDLPMPGAVPPEFAALALTASDIPPPGKPPPDIPARAVPRADFPRHGTAPPRAAALDLSAPDIPPPGKPPPDIPARDIPRADIPMPDVAPQCVAALVLTASDIPPPAKPPPEIPARGVPREDLPMHGAAPPGAAALDLTASDIPQTGKPPPDIPAQAVPRADFPMPGAAPPDFGAAPLPVGESTAPGASPDPPRRGPPPKPKCLKNLPGRGRGLYPAADPRQHEPESARYLRQNYPDVDIGDSELRWLRRIEALHGAEQLLAILRRAAENGVSGENLWQDLTRSLRASEGKLGSVFMPA